MKFRSDCGSKYIILSYAKSVWLRLRDMRKTTKWFDHCLIGKNILLWAYKTFMKLDPGASRLCNIFQVYSVANRPIMWLA